MALKEEALDKLFQQVEENKIILPDFQREFVWDESKQKNLIASFLVGIPINNFLRIGGFANDFTAKKLCYKSQVNVNITSEECSYLLDGQQRASSLKAAFTDLFENDIENWEQLWDNYENGLLNRWFLELKHYSIDAFGFEKLKFPDSMKYFEPDDVFPYIKSVSIKEKTSKDKEYWYHPAYQEDRLNKKIKNYTIINDIADQAAKRDMIPLYGIKGELSKLVIEKIAEKRRDQLKASVKDEVESIVELLEWKEPSISDYIESKDEEAIRKAWDRLMNDWCREMQTYLESLIKEKTLVFIELEKNELARAIAIFKSINEGGTKLDAYDLVVALAAKEQRSQGDGARSLTKVIIDTIREMEKEKLPDSIIQEAGQDQFSAEYLGIIYKGNLVKSFKQEYLNILSLLSCSTNITTSSVGNAAALKLNSATINANTPEAVKALIRAIIFLHIKCGLLNLTKLQYQLMLLPIALMVKDDDVWNDVKKINKIEYWYWSSLFSGAYRENQKEVCVEDIKYLGNFVNGISKNEFSSREDKIFNDQGYSDVEVLTRVNKDKKVVKAIENGILNYILTRCPSDFLKTYDVKLTSWKAVKKHKEILPNGKGDVSIHLEIHHIIPLASSEDIKIKESTQRIRNTDHILNSPLNKTYITKTANNTIGAQCVSAYMEGLSNYSLQTHCIPAVPNLKQKANEKEENYYVRILKERFNYIKNEMAEELKNLKE